MAVQLGIALAEAPPPDSLRRRYLQALAATVRPTERAEEALLRAAVQRAFTATERSVPGIWPDSLALITVSGEQYGAGTFYTRERAIIVPLPVLQTGDTAALTRVMVHEIFHLFSRLHRSARADLYGVFGFERPAQPIGLPDSLEARRLLNPDGIEEDWVITLDGVPYVPLLLIGPQHAATAALSFVDAYHYGYYPLERRAGRYHLRSSEAARLGPAFAALTGGNTDYIIHPEEIAADNFVRLVVPSSSAPPSADGRRVLTSLAQLLRRWSE